MFESRESSSARVPVLIAALALVAAALVAAPVAADEQDLDYTPEVVSNAGADRYETAAEIAMAAFDDPADVLLASGANYPDALAAAALAGVVEGPILLTRPGSLPTATAEALAALDPDTVHLLGGTAAVGADVEDEVEALDFPTTRIAGANRYETAQAIAETVTELGGSVGEVDGATTVLLASGANFPDALAGGPGAYDSTHPILLSEGESLRAETSAALDGLGPAQVVILGGTAAVPSAVEDELVGEGYDVTRIGGADRYDTAKRVSAFFLRSVGFDAANVGLATGVQASGGVDALAAAPYLGSNNAPLVLTDDPLPTRTSDFLSEFASAIGALHVFGGRAAVPESVIADAQRAVSNPQYVVDLSWINEVDDSGDEPKFFQGPVDAMGEGILTLNRAEGSIDYQVSTGSDGPFDEAPGVHIHAGGFAENGPIVTFLADGDALEAGQGTVEGTVTEDDFEDDFSDVTVNDIVEDLRSYYVNLHSNAYPAGMVRGQLPFGGQFDVAAQGATFEVALAPENEVVEEGAPDPTEVEASGTAALVFRTDANEVEFDLQASIPDDDTFLGAPGAHLHDGRLGENGPVLFAFASADELDAGDGRVSGTISLDAEAISVEQILIDPGAYYVNVHTEAFPAGIVRGQLPDGGQERLGVDG